MSITTTMMEKIRTKKTVRIKSTNAYKGLQMQILGIKYLSHFEELKNEVNQYRDSLNAQEILSIYNRNSKSHYHGSIKEYWIPYGENFLGLLEHPEINDENASSKSSDEYQNVEKGCRFSVQYTCHTSNQSTNITTMIRDKIIE